MLRSRLSLSLLIVIAAVGAIAVTSATGAPTAPPTPRLSDSVAAIFAARCVHCHGPDDDSGGLRLDSHAAIIRGGERGPAVVPGKPDASVLLQKVLRRDKPAMPPRRPLVPAETKIIREWIAAGAPR